jgi:hypothetical protein
MSNKYFKPSVSYWWNETITFATSLSNRTKEFGKTKVLASRTNTKGQYEQVWADPSKAGLPNNIHLKNVSYGYVPSGESSTSICWLTNGERINIDNIQYIVYMGTRIRKEEYDNLYEPHQKVYPPSLIKLKYNSSLQESLPNTVRRLRVTGEWSRIGEKRLTSNYARKYDIETWIGNFQSGLAISSRQKLKALGYVMRIPSKAIGLSMHRPSEFSNGLRGDYSRFACYINQNNYRPYEMVA